MSGKKVSRNATKLLTTRQILQAGDGDHSDGAGLYLRIRGANAAWMFRYTAASGRRREMGLGAADRSTSEIATASAIKARLAAEDARKQLAAGHDPIDARRASRTEERVAKATAKTAAKADATTLARFAREYHELLIEPHLSGRHAATWIASLEQHVPAATWHRPIAQVEAGELLDFLVDLYRTVPETASRVRQRLETVFDDALLRKVVTTNPAAVIRRTLGKVTKRQKVKHYRSLPYSNVPAFMRRLESQEGVAATALRLLILTAARTGEILNATRDEFDVGARVWRIAGSRMKGGEDHVVYLSDAALNLVVAQLDDPSADPKWIFASPTGNGMPLSNMAMLTLLRRMKVDQLMTVHGARSSFSTWANETNAARDDVVEACLAHKEADRVRAAYNRAVFAAERRALLEDWATFCTTTAPTGDTGGAASQLGAIDEKATSQPHDDAPNVVQKLSTEEVTTAA